MRLLSMYGIKTKIVFILVMATFTFACAPSYEEQWENFQRWEGTEETMMDPLIVSGDGIVITVLKKIKDKKQVGRGVAIMFLWNGDYKQAIPVLEEILKDQNDDERVRAMLAIYGLDPVLGMSYAKQLQNQHDELGKTAKSIVKTKTGWLADKRYFTDAFISYYTDWMH